MSRRRKSPRVILLGGPNGAGKTTTAKRLLPDFLSLRAFVNADAIAAGLSAFAPDSVARQAGRLMIRRLQELARERADFAFETTLASRTFAPFLRRCRSRGYRVTVIYLWLESADLAVDRVSLRVRTGGHDVPEATVRRRYEAGWRSFLDLYRPIADEWQAYDNTSAQASLVAQASADGIVSVMRPATWAIIEAGPKRS